MAVEQPVVPSRSNLTSFAIRFSSALIILSSSFDRIASASSFLRLPKHILAGCVAAIPTDCCVLTSAVVCVVARLGGSRWECSDGKSAVNVTPCGFQ